MYDLLVNLAASVVAGSAVWTAQFLLAYRRRARMRRFFGLADRAECVVIAPRHASSERLNSVHRQDVAAIVELATTAKECGATARLIGPDEAPSELGRVTEFCVGGPGANPRTAAHLRSVLPGVRFDEHASREELTFWVGTRPFRREVGGREYVLLARTQGAGHACPTFLVLGQRAYTNLAAARYLSSRHRDLRRKYGVSGRFCIVLEIAQPEAYGSDLMRVAAEVTDDAFRPRLDADRPAADGGNSDMDDAPVANV